MSATVVLTWTFSPENLFEEKVQIEKEGYTIAIGTGIVEARIPEHLFDANPAIRAELNETINVRFIAAQLLNHKPYELSAGSMTKEYPDGRRDVFIEAPTLCMTISAQADFVLTGIDGAIKKDSRRERIDRRKALGEQFASLIISDEPLLHMLRSYNAAVNDPNNELVHLYDIRDAFSSQFGGDKKAYTTLNISKSDWSKFGQLCNNSPLRQGRHRGNHLGSLRDADIKELETARSLAFSWIEKYAAYLTSANNNKENAVNE